MALVPPHPIFLEEIEEEVAIDIVLADAADILRVMRSLEDE